MPMSRFSRINCIWRKELLDTLRDRRTVIAMVLVPMVLYPALMLGSLQALEVQVSYLVAEKYTVAVASPEVERWLRGTLESDPARRGDETGTQPSTPSLADGSQASPPGKRGVENARASAGQSPPEYDIRVAADPAAEVGKGAHAALVVDGALPQPDSHGTCTISVMFDDSDIRGQIAARGLTEVLKRANAELLAQRLRSMQLAATFNLPIQVAEWNIATPEQMSGSVLGQIVPLILIIMTITGAIYPAIDLTAGERERNTLETLMVAPVPTVDLIAGKFIVVTMIGLLSAVLNLLSVGGTIYLGGVGSLLTQGREMILPLHALPWVLVLLVPLAVLFSALLLAVCSFARSFKEAQNYIVPVMMAGLIPGVVGVLPGTRLEGPILIVPVANIVVLIRELFRDSYNYEAIVWVLLSTSLYAGAAVAVAAKLFGQEAVLFADAGSVRTLFQRRYFKPRAVPSAAHALLVATIVFSLNFFIQQELARSGFNRGMAFLTSVSLTIVVLVAVFPWLATVYTRVNPLTTFALKLPDARAWLAAVCFGCSTWVLVLSWLHVQNHYFPMDRAVQQALARELAWLGDTDPWVLVFFLALVPAIAEELFYRGYVLSGLRPALGRWGAVAVAAIAFALMHHSAHRLISTALLGVLFGLLVTRYGAIWPAMLAHFLHNGITVMMGQQTPLRQLLEAMGYPGDSNAAPPGWWVLAATGLLLVGLALCIRMPARGTLSASPSLAEIGTAKR